MQQIIIGAEAKSVYVNGNSIINLPIQIPANVLVLNWYANTVGSIFYVNGTEEKITSLPAWAQQCVDIYNMSLPPEPPAPTPEEVNKNAASAELYATDWTSIPDIIDPAKCTPTLLNQADFLIYRNQLRVIAVNPPAMVVSLPIKPIPQWSE